ncbi:MAG: hypothetical protein AAF152_15900 [Cyanobacteria bacterium P01_A01_bin.114]
MAYSGGKISGQSKRAKRRNRRRPAYTPSPNGKPSTPASGGGR